MKTTAQLREEARDAASACRWSDAADLYEQALMVYPANHADSQLALRDKEALKQRADSCRNMVAKYGPNGRR